MTLPEPYAFAISTIEPIQPAHQYNMTRLYAVWLANLKIITLIFPKIDNEHFQKNGGCMNLFKTLIQEIN